MIQAFINAPLRLVRPAFVGVSAGITAELGRVCGAGGKLTLPPRGWETPGHTSLQAVVGLAQKEEKREVESRGSFPDPHF